MTALNTIENVAQEGVNTVGGATRVVTSPFASNRSTPEALDRFVRKRVGTLLDGVLLVPSTAALYYLLSSNEEESGFVTLGKGTGIGLSLYVASAILRRWVL